MLTINTQIPTIARATIRALVKAHPAWPAFRAEKNIISASASNSDLLEFALRHPQLTADIETVLGASNAALETLASKVDAETTSEQNAIDAANNTATPPPVTVGPFDLDSILSPVDQFLSPLVRNELTKALSPVLDKANAGPVEIERVVEIERIVEVAPGEAPRVVLPKARRGQKTTFRTLYPSRKKDSWLDATLTLWTGVPVNNPDPFYVVDHDNMALLMTAMERGTNSWIFGPPAGGKSTIAEEASIALGRPFVKLGMTRQTEVESLIGGMALRNGNTVWEDGALIKAIRQPGMVILIDELTIAPAGVQAIFQLLCDDHRTITLPTGEIVKCADGVVFIVADNTSGCGDEGGLYAGTNISNAALVTRFKRMIFIDYMNAAKESEALANHTACPLPAARKLADLIAQARRLPALSGVVVSLRQMIGFIQCIQDGFTSKQAFEVTISSRMPATERAAIEALVDLTWQAEFEALVNNKPVPPAPSNSPAANAFKEQF